MNVLLIMEGVTRHALTQPVVMIALVEMVTNLITIVMDVMVRFP